jgi:hypothetical protein
MSGDQTYVIRKTERGYEIAGPVLTTPSVFQSEAEAVHSSGMRDFYQGSKSLTNDGAFQR